MAFPRSLPYPAEYDDLKRLGRARTPEQEARMRRIRLDVRAAAYGQRPSARAPDDAAAPAPEIPPAVPPAAPPPAPSPPPGPAEERPVFSGELAALGEGPDATDGAAAPPGAREAFEIALSAVADLACDVLKGLGAEPPPEHRVGKVVHAWGGVAEVCGWLEGADPTAIVVIGALTLTVTTFGPAVIVARRNVRARRGRPAPPTPTPQEATHA